MLENESGEGEVPGRGHCQSKGLLCPERFLLSSYVLRPSRGTGREGAEGTPVIFPEKEALTYSPKKWRSRSRATKHLGSFQ